MRFSGSFNACASPTTWSSSVAALASSFALSSCAFAASGVVVSCAIAAIVTIKTAKATKRDWIMRLLFMVFPREKTESDCVAMLDDLTHVLVTPRVPKSAGSREWHGRLARGTHAQDARAAQEICWIGGHLCGKLRAFR